MSHLGTSWQPPWDLSSSLLETSGENAGSLLETSQKHTRLGVCWRRSADLQIPAILFTNDTQSPKSLLGTTHLKHLGNLLGYLLELDWQRPGKLRDLLESFWVAPGLRQLSGKLSGILQATYPGSLRGASQNLLGWNPHQSFLEASRRNYGSLIHWEPPVMFLEACRHHPES